MWFLFENNFSLRFYSRARGFFFPALPFFCYYLFCSAGVCGTAVFCVLREVLFVVCERTLHGMRAFVCVCGLGLADQPLILLVCCCCWCLLVRSTPSSVVARSMRLVVHTYTRTLLGKTRSDLSRVEKNAQTIHCTRKGDGGGGGWKCSLCCGADEQMHLCMNACTHTNFYTHRTGNAHTHTLTGQKLYAHNFSQTQGCRTGQASSWL